MRIKKDTIHSLQRRIFSFYKKNRRRLPFRNTRDPYHITVSEIMLQQTQVDRVIPFYERWTRRWPSFRSLAKATNKQLLSEWSGLGYNRRALNLGALAKVVTNNSNGKLPKNESLLLALPGIGAYTANAILIFAFNENRVTIDTNIRRVLIHELRLSPNISLKNLQAVAQEALPKGKSRAWHNALMDYATLALPKTPHIKPLSRQPKFDGSIRQIRGLIVSMLTKKNFVTQGMIARRSKRSTADVQQAIKALKKDGVITGSSKLRLA